MIASVHLVAVRDIKQHGALRIQQLKGAGEHIQARDDAIGLGDKLHRGGTRRGTHARRAHVLKGNVLAQSLQNQIIDDELHGNGIHGLLLHGLCAGGTGQIIDCQGVGAQGAMTSAGSPACSTASDSPVRMYHAARRPQTRDSSKLLEARRFLP